MLFFTYDTMVKDAHFIHKDMPQRFSTIPHKEFCLQCAWGLILSGSGPISISQIVRSTRAKSTQSNVQVHASLPLDPNCYCEHLPVHLGEGKWMGCWLCCWKQRNSHTKNTKSPPKTCWAYTQCNWPLCLNDERYCFVEFHQLQRSGMGGGAERRGGAVAGGGTFGGAAEFTQPHLM